MTEFIIWLIGFFIVTITLGVLYHKGIIKWSPWGDAMPHMAVGAVWPVAVPIIALGFILYGLHKSIDWVCRFIANGIKISRR